MNWIRVYFNDPRSYCIIISTKFSSSRVYIRMHGEKGGGKKSENRVWERNVLTNDGDNDACRSTMYQDGNSVRMKVELTIFQQWRAMCRDIDESIIFATFKAYK